MSPAAAARPDARALALHALVRVESDGAYANLVLPAMLAQSRLDDRDRRFATELAYGTVRMQRSCDWLCDRFLTREVEPEVRAALRLGAYQLAFLATPPHAAVNATVAVAPKRARGLVNAVLRRVAEGPRDWPSEGVRLSYPDWIIDRLVDDLGPDLATGALEAMNQAGEVTERADGYVQDRASQWVAEYVAPGEADLVADLCAAPGGKATAMVSTARTVVASDVAPGRTGLVVSNASRLGVRLPAVVADGRWPPYRPEAFDRVLLDAPCSGLGALRRRPDARWRVEPEAVERLAALQRQLVDAAVPLLAPGGHLVYSVCTLTNHESLSVADHVATTHPALEPLVPPGPPWTPLGTGARLLPQERGTDGMIVFGWRRS